MLIGVTLIAIISFFPKFKGMWKNAKHLLDANSSLAWRVIVLHQILFWMGVMIGKGFPALNQHLSNLGAQALSRSGIQTLSGMLELAGGIFAWNSVVGLLLTNALPNAVAGLGSLVVNLPRMTAVGIALSDQNAAVLALHTPTILLELSAYALMSLAGILALQELGKGLRARSEFNMQLAQKALRPTWILFPVSLLLLLLGAWYEAAEIQWLIPLVR